MADKNIDIAIRARNQASGAFKEVKAELAGLDGAAKAASGGLAGIAGAFGAGAIIGIAQQATAAIFDLASQAANVQALGRSFDQLAASAGESGSSMLASMREASQGTIADADLMLSANKAMMLGVADSAAEMGKLLEVAAVRGKAMGLSTGQAFSDLVTGIGRMSPLILDNLGIVTGGEAVFDDYAASLGRTAASLSDVEKKQALLNKVISETDTSAIPVANQFERMDAAIQNAKAALGQMFGPAVAAIAQQLADTVTATVAAVENPGPTLAVANLQKGLVDARAELQKLIDLQAEQSDLPFVSNGNIGFAEGREEYDQPAPEALTPDTSKLDEAKAKIKELEEAIVSLQRYQKAMAEDANAFDPKVDRLREYNAEMERFAEQAKRASPYYFQLATATREVATAEEMAAAQATFAKYSMEAFAQAMAGANAMSAALVGGLSQVQAQAGATAGIIYNLTGAIAQLHAVSNANLSKPDALDRVLPQINTVGGGLVDDLGLDGAIAKTDELKIQNRELYEQLKATGKYTEDEIYMALSANVNQTQKWASGLGQVQAGTAAVNKEYSDLQSKVSGVLSSALDVGVGVKASDILPREDEINENARRLAAIAQEGLIGQPWLEEFKAEAPGAWADIMLQVAAGVDAKTAAARILRDFEDGMRPDLIDKALVKERVKRMIIGDQSMAALAEEIAGELAAEMNIPLSQAMAAAGSALGVSTGAEGEAATGAAGETSAPDMTGTGATAGGTFAAGFASTANGVTLVGGLVASMATVDLAPVNGSGAMAGTQWGLGFTDNADGVIIAASIITKLAGELPRFKTSGASAGTQWGAGFMGTVETGIAQPLISLLTTLVTPGVLAAIQAGTTQTEAP